MTINSEEHASLNLLHELTRWRTILCFPFFSTCSTFCFTSTEAKWLIGGGGGGGRLNCGYHLKKTGETVDRCQNNGSVKVVFPRHCTVTSALYNCRFNCRAGQSHTDNVCCTAVEELLEAKEVQLLQPSSSSLLMISAGLTWGSSSTSLLLILPATPK